MSEISTSRGGKLPWRQIWRQYFDFLRRPELPPRPEPFGPNAVREIVALFALDAAAMSLFVLIAARAIAFGVYSPHNKLEDLPNGPWLIALMVVFAPLIEESLFRGWLSGTRRALAVFGTPTFAILVALLARWLTGPLSVAAILLLVGAAIAGVIYGIVTGEAKSVPPQYRALFPAAFWLSAGVFAALHLSNYTGHMGTFALLWVVPQFVGATFFGYTRVRFGMWANISLHAAHNGFAALMMLLGS